MCCLCFDMKSERSYSLASVKGFYMNIILVKRRFQVGLALLPLVLVISLLMHFYFLDRADVASDFRAQCSLTMAIAALSGVLWLILLVLYFTWERLAEFYELRWGRRPMTMLDARMVKLKSEKIPKTIGPTLIIIALFLAIIASGTGLWIVRSKVPMPYKVVEFGTVAEWNQLVLKYPNVLDAKPKGGRTLLMTAIQTARGDMVEALLNSGVSVNAVDGTGRTPVFYALDKPWVLESLLRSGADVKHIDPLGYSPLHYAIAQKSIESFELLVEYGANVNAPSKSMKSPLMLAVENELDAVEFLLLHGADPAVSDMVGQTPLHYAAIHDDANAVRALVKSGAQKTARTAQQWTPLHLAAINSNIEVAEVLLENGVNVDSSNKRNQTPLRCAVRRGHVDMVEFLLKNGADVNLEDARGNTYLHDALAEGNAVVAELLIEQGARSDIENKTGLTAKEILEMRKMQFPQLKSITFTD